MSRKHPRYRRLYFFPALLPLAELVPWLLSFVAAAAGASGFFNGPFWQRWRLAFLGLAIVCVAAAGGMYAHLQRPPAISLDGSKPVPVAEYPKPEAFVRKPAKVATPEHDGFTMLWAVTTKKQILSAPVVVGDLILYGTFQGSVEAASIADGAPVWSLKLKDYVFSLTPDGAGIVFAGEGLHYSEDSYLSAIKADTGSVLWQRRFYGHLEEGFAHDAKGGRIFLSTGPGGLWAVRTENGEPLWNAAIGHIDAEPLWTGDTVYVPAQPDEKKIASALFALDAQTGKTKWQLPLPGQPWGSPLMDKSGGVVLSSTGQGQIGVTRKTDTGYAQGISPEGKLLWQISLPSMPIQPAMYLPEADIVIHSVKSGDIIALAAQSGKIAWRTRVGNDLQASATLFRAGGRAMLAVSSADGHFAILDALTGHDIRRMEINKHCTSAPVFAGDTLYVTTAYTISAFSGLSALAREE